MVAAVLLIGVAGCHRNSSEEQAAAVTGPVGVTTEVVRAAPLRATVSAAGTIQPAPAGDWTIYPPESGRIEELARNEGEAVKQGDVLVRFEIGNLSQEVTQREAEFEAASVKLDGAKATLTRISALFDRGYTARNDLEVARNGVTQAESDLARTKQQLDLARLAAERATIKARFDGVIAKKYHNAGDLVNGAISDPVLRVIDPSRVQAVVQVPVAQLGQVLSGQQAMVISGVNPAGDAATVAVKPPLNDPQAASGEVRLAFTGPVALPIDSPVQVEILLDQRANAIAVPLKAVLKGNDEARFVLIAGSDNRAHRRDVKVGLTTRDRIEIVSGLTAGERVIVSNLEALTEGAEIVVER